MLGVILFVVGYLVLSVTEIVSPMFILSIVGCIPLLVVVSHTARNTLCGMGELARSFRIPLHRYVQARFLMAGLISLMINFSVTAMVTPLGKGVYAAYDLAMVHPNPNECGGSVSIIYADT